MLLNGQFPIRMVIIITGVIHKLKAIRDQLGFLRNLRNEF